MKNVSLFRQRLHGLDGESREALDSQRLRVFPRVGLFQNLSHPLPRIIAAKPTRESQLDRRCSTGDYCRSLRLISRARSCNRMHRVGARLRCRWHGRLHRVNSTLASGLCPAARCTGLRRGQKLMDGGQEECMDIIETVQHAIQGLVGLLCWLEWAISTIRSRCTPGLTESPMVQPRKPCAYLSIRFLKSHFTRLLWRGCHTAIDRV